MSRDGFKESSQIHEALGIKMQEMSTATVLYHQRIAQYLGLNPTDHKCLDFIMKNEYMTAGDLAQLTGLTTGAVTGVIDRLESKELARREKDPNDRRKIVVVANKEKAFKEVGPLFSSLGASMDNLYKEYSERELQTILDFVTKSVEIVQNELKK
ncbi:MarR family transcriptional regulator [Bacillus luteolus]|uniref:MarR family transcriptional regulator n=1 Tax=Litchfieldia luteola TaxID=682179 RepID=A0ABR9QL70_9BACI|nr:MarR family transcriptional regulator [Cytobacillus luteolus]MBE4909238.1 MarR family transcriptional regulator [Cytobacillus luteolus]MBP1940305.1 DNA-binding MarR family transcriptional regulator [Cytobacillus luteolus]